MPSTETYATILTSDDYVPGALVLGRALRSFHTLKRLVVLTTELSPASQRLLREVYDELLEVEAIESDLFEQLHELNRPELYQTYTKMALWTLTQFSKIVFLDADVLPVQSLDALFDVAVAPGQIAAAPDSGWPDIFNSGVFVTVPNAAVYAGLTALSEEPNASFDGADQGLLNEYFHARGANNWIRLPFTYNVTPSAGYQYTPAYRRFRDDIRAVHFIGTNKPWCTRDSWSFAAAYGGFDAVFDLHAQWWAIHEAAYGKAATATKGEAHEMAIKKVENAWDTGATKAPPTLEEVAPATVESEPPVKPLFPWEAKGPSTPTRHFETGDDTLWEKLKQSHISQ